MFRRKHAAATRIVEGLSNELRRQVETANDSKPPYVARIIVVLLLMIQWRLIDAA